MLSSNNYGYLKFLSWKRCRNVMLCIVIPLPNHRANKPYWFNGDNVLAVSFLAVEKYRGHFESSHLSPVPLIEVMSAPEQLLWAK
jgi:hypothetical protein